MSTKHPAWIERAAAKCQRQADYVYPSPRPVADDVAEFAAIIAAEAPDLSALVEMQSALAKVYRWLELNNRLDSVIAPVVRNALEGRHDLTH